MTTFRYADHDNAMVLVTFDDGSTSFVPAGSAVLARLIAEVKALTGETPNIAAYVAPAPTKADVNAERDRRLAAGYMHQFGAAGEHRLDTRDVGDLVNWTALSIMAAQLIAAGQGATPLPIRDADNETFEASATGISEALAGMAMWRAAVLKASWDIKDLPEIPADYADDGRWP